MFLFLTLHSFLQAKISFYTSSKATLLDERDTFAQSVAFAANVPYAKTQVEAKLNNESNKTKPVDQVEGKVAEQVQKTPPTSIVVEEIPRFTVEEGSDEKYVWHFHKLEQL